MAAAVICLCYCMRQLRRVSALGMCAQAVCQVHYDPGARAEYELVVYMYSLVGALQLTSHVRGLSRISRWG